MKRILLPTLLALLAMALWAKPARRVLVTLTQPDGTRIEAISAGDEFYHYYDDVLTGQRLICDSATGFWRIMTPAEKDLSDQRWQQRRAEFSCPPESMRPAPKPQGTASDAASPTLGHHRLPCLLVSWSDMSFSEVWKKDSVKYASIGDLYHDMMNGGADYRFCDAVGAVNQYFYDQSYGKYEVEFDVIGPITVSQRHDCDRKQAYTPAREAWVEALDSAFAQGLITAEMIEQWDNDGDGLVDLLYVFYAGYSSAESPEVNKEYIWPHQWYFYGSSSHRFPGTSCRFYKYSCSSELMGLCTDTLSNGQPNLYFDGIGTASHEFGHALGLPDFYNASNSGQTVYGMQTWSVMDVGCYNNNGHTPPSYTTFERYSLGWVTPAELPEYDVIELTPFDRDSVCYILTNPDNPDEFLTFECHQQQGWDSHYGTGYLSLQPFEYTHGMLITHVDYSSEAWSGNTVNSRADLQRCTILPADGSLYPYDKVQGDWSRYQLYKEELFSDIFPGKKNITACSSDSNPAMVWHTGEPINLILDNIEELPDGTLRMTVLQPANVQGDAIESILSDPNQTASPRLVGRGNRLFIEHGTRQYDLQGLRR